jgi:hypothetical protein
MHFLRDKVEHHYFHRLIGMDTAFSFNTRKFLILITAFIAFFSFLIPAVNSQVAPPLSAKKSNPLIGTWAITEPELGKLLLIVRDGGVVSYFWEEWKDDRVLRAEWNTSQDGISFETEAGHKISLSPTDEQGATARIRKPDHPADVPLEKLTAQRLNPDDVGKWHRPGGDDEETSSFLKKAGNLDVFFGTWEVISSKGLPYYIVIEEDRTAATNWPYSSRGVDGMRGFWVRHGSELHIVWDTGHYDILRSFSNKFIKLGYPPSIDLNSIEPAPQPALKVKWYPHEPWRASYEKSKKEKTPIDPRWTSARKAARYFRGDWKLMSSPGVWNKLEMGRFGSAETIREGEKLGGNWKNSSDYARIHWKNGYAEVLRPVGKHFVTMLYSPLKNLDGIPDRVCPVVQDRSGKLSETGDKILDKGETLLEQGGKLIRFPKLNLFGRDKD